MLSLIWGVLFIVFCVFCAGSPRSGRMKDEDGDPSHMSVFLGFLLLVFFFGSIPLTNRVLAGGEYVLKDTKFLEPISDEFYVIERNGGGGINPHSLYYREGRQLIKKPKNKKIEIRYSSSAPRIEAHEFKLKHKLGGHQLVRGPLSEKVVFYVPQNTMGLFEDPLDSEFWKIINATKETLTPKTKEANPQPKTPGGKIAGVFLFVTQTFWGLFLGLLTCGTLLATLSWAISGRKRQ